VIEAKGNCLPVCPNRARILSNCAAADNLQPTIPKYDRLLASLQQSVSENKNFSSFLAAYQVERKGNWRLPPINQDLSLAGSR
jgi:hypothetical protein